MNNFKKCKCHCVFLTTGMVCLSNHLYASFRCSKISELEIEFKASQQESAENESSCCDDTINQDDFNVAVKDVVAQSIHCHHEVMQISRAIQLHAQFLDKAEIIYNISDLFVSLKDIMNIDQGVELYFVDYYHGAYAFFKKL